MLTVMDILGCLFLWWWIVQAAPRVLGWMAAWKWIGQPGPDGWGVMPIAATCLLPVGLGLALVVV